MLRIGICAPYDLGRDGGVNSHIRAQAAALRRRGHVVRVFGAASAPLPDGEIALSGCISPVIGGTETGIGIDPRAWFRVGALFGREAFDIVHVHEPLMPIVPWCAVWRARAPVVATFHTHREQGHRFYRRYRALLAPLMRRVDARIAVSEAARRTVDAHFPGEYLVVPNGIEAARFGTPAPRPPAFERPMQVLCVGRLEPRKGVEHLVDAMAILQRTHRGARLVVVGDGPDRAAIEARARASAVDAVFLGRVPDAELPACYQAADVVCAPATGGESFGIVLLEAMAAGRPVVATAIDGYLELAGNDRTRAAFVPPGDAAALADAVAALLQDPDRRRALGARGAAFAARFDWAAIAAELETLYARLAGSTGIRSAAAGVS